jgi:hypothetical protein
MPNIIKNNLEKVLKEYLSSKNYLMEFSKKENIEKVKADIAKYSFDKEESEIEEYFFKELGWIGALEADVIQLKIRLYHTYEAYKDLVDPPEDLLTLIKEELKGITFKLSFDVKGNSLKVADEEAYNFYKKQYFQGQEYLKKNNNG